MDIDKERNLYVQIRVNPLSILGKDAQKGGKAEGTLAIPVRCDLDVLKQVAEEAEAIALALT